MTLPALPAVLDNRLFTRFDFLAFSRQQGISVRAWHNDTGSRMIRFSQPFQSIGATRQS
jgi:hypothetical protein